VATDEENSDGTLDDVAPLGSRYHVSVHRERSDYWAEVDELPGCFASGDDLAELKEALAEAIELYTSTRTRRNHIDRMIWRRSRTNDDRFLVTVSARPATSPSLLPRTRLRGQVAERRKATA
jgi:predicted RNase H-like HicB family nuclease